MNDKESARLIAAQRWKLWICGLAWVVIGACCISPASFADVIHVDPGWVLFFAPLVGLLVLVGACLSVRCPSCGLSLVWHGFELAP
jgi:FtsH-binding integral membrane protein